MKALVVDDDVYCLKLTGDYLRYKGFEVTELLTPNCSADKTEQGVFSTYDVVVSDNRMPGMTGVEFLDYLSSAECPLPPERKALLTGDITQIEFSHAVERGYRVFRKPCSLESLDHWLAEIFPDLD